MTRESPGALLEIAVDVAWRAGRVTLAHFQTGVTAELKADQSFVTIADRESERLARELIEARFPHDGILGEEFGETRSGARRRWVLDPIDGTNSFVRGVPLYGVLVGVEEEGAAIVGVLHFPALGETVCAALGEGCWWNGRRARVSECTRIGDAVALTSDEESIQRHARAEGWNRLRNRTRFTRTWGDCYGYALVATGRAEVMVDAIVSAWDTTAVRPVIQEAGGVFTDWDGIASHTSGHAIATNAALAQEVRSLLGGDA
ncbi:MAG: histidinol-phosphatase [Anaerolineae bacterium]|nr:histidinol-phosphatase [Gemmatimonadaceae bacterium]